MPSLTLPDRLIWFAHCPKAGGTSVEQFMVAHWGEAVGHLHWGWDLWWRDGGWRVADPPNSPQHLVWNDAITHLPRPPDAVFALVRDPVARMASEYRWQRHHRRGTKLGKALAYMPFPIWLRVMLTVARKNPHAFDNHFRSQTEFVPEGARVFRLEDGIEPAINWLTAAADATPTEQVIPHAIPSGRALRVHPRDVAFIAHVFAADYARFGYRFPAGLTSSEPRKSVVGLLASLIAFLDRRGWL